MGPFPWQSQNSQEFVRRPPSKKKYYVWSRVLGKGFLFCQNDHPSLTHTADLRARSGSASWQYAFVILTPLIVTCQSGLRVPITVFLNPSLPYPYSYDHAFMFDFTLSFYSLCLDKSVEVKSVVVTSSNQRGGNLWSVRLRDLPPACWWMHMCVLWLSGAC